MGGGSYSSTSRLQRSVASGYTTKSAKELFSKQINNAMTPHGVVVRESRDSVEHPNSLAIIIALDITGSMGTVPHHLVKEGLPKIMQSILDSGFPDPQVMFVAIGDHECDDWPLQVSQFESSDELLDKWLTSVFLEGGGGGNAGESYALAWYFAAKHTAIDCMEKRGIKGLVFTIGDEPNLKEYPDGALTHIMGNGQYNKMSSDKDLYDAARKNYELYHIHISETTAGSRRDTVDGWKQLLGDNLIKIDRHQDVADAIAKAVIKHTSSIKQTWVSAGEEQTNTSKKEETSVML
jgi:hypothetical protein